MTPTRVEDQLRIYADNIDEHLATGGAPADLGAARAARSARRNSRSIWLFSAAAACIVAIVLIFIGTNDPVAIDTGDFAAEPTTESASEPTPEPANAANGDPAAAVAANPSVRRYLQADPAQWVVVEHYGYDGSDSPQNDDRVTPAVWVWRLDGKLVFFHTGEAIAYGEPVPLAEAVVWSEANRSTLGWQTASGRVGLVGVGIDAEQLKIIAAELDNNVQNPAISRAELVHHEPERFTPGPRSEQFELAPIDANGVPVPQSRVSAAATEGSLGDLYSELSNVSSLGIVSEYSIGGVEGFVVDGSNSDLDDSFALSYALVAIDGWVYRWQTQSRNADFLGLLDSVEQVSESAWDQTVDQRGANVKALAEAAFTTAELDLSDLAAPADLPRFVMPEPWEIEWVTDMGIWTDDQRAHWAGQILASQPTQTPLVVSRTQAFEFTATGTEPNYLVPDLEMSIAVFESEPIGQTGFQDGSTPITVGELSGTVSPENLTRENQLGAINTVELKGDKTRVFISSQVVPRDDLIDFAESLVPRQGGPGAGFDSSDERFEQMVDITNDEWVDGTVLLAPATRWNALWSLAGDAPGTVHISVEQLSLDKLRLKLGSERPYLARDIDETVDATGNFSLRADTPGVAMRYDSRTQVMILVTATGAAVPAGDVLDNQLIELDLEAWTTRITPFNSDPLNPR